MRGIIAKKLRGLCSITKVHSKDKTYTTDPKTGARILTSSPHIIYNQLKKLRKKGG